MYQLSQMEMSLLDGIIACALILCAVAASLGCIWLVLEGISKIIQSSESRPE